MLACFFLPTKGGIMERIITKQLKEKFEQILCKEEKYENTIKKYLRDLEKFKQYLSNRCTTKEEVIGFKEYLQNHYKTSSINSFLAAINHFFEVVGWQDLKIKSLKIQKQIFLPEERYLTKREYQRLISAAMSTGKERIALIIQAIGSTGIRISELSYITVESLRKGRVEIKNKGKIRQVFYPKALQKVLLRYSKKMKITEGILFRTSTGKAVNRSNVWREMKNLCKKAGVNEEKVFPHNLRHLFARCFYEIKKDIAKLADVLGPSSIDTTRIDIKTTGREHMRQLEKMGMVVTT